MVQGDQRHGELVDSLSSSEEKLMDFLKGVMPAGFLNPAGSGQALSPAPTNS